jgi:DNA-binding LacI/PurR family transcriptional regulator
MTTMKDIAKRAGVGLGTVSRVVNGTGPVSQETREKVEAALSEMNYRPNRIARKLVSGNTGRGFYGVLMPLFIHPFYFYVLRECTVLWKSRI